MNSRHRLSIVAIFCLTGLLIPFAAATPSVEWTVEAGQSFTYSIVEARGDEINLDGTLNLTIDAIMENGSLVFSSVGEWIVDTHNYKTYFEYASIQTDTFVDTTNDFCPFIYSTGAFDEYKEGLSSGIDTFLEHCERDYGENGDYSYSAQKLTYGYKHQITNEQTNFSVSEVVKYDRTGILQEFELIIIQYGVTDRILYTNVSDSVSISGLPVALVLGWSGLAFGVLRFRRSKRIQKDKHRR